tara:strand:+ start:950 stop:1120 length:171 start_codon:yes stop_codon:yes gene_type:complete
MKVGDLVKQKKTMGMGAPSPAMLVTSISRDGKAVYVLFENQFWLLNKERLEVINCS